MITNKMRILLSVLLLSAISFAQVNVNVNIKRPIPNKVSTWEQDPTIIQLVLQNTSQQSYPDAYISVEVKNDAGSIVGKTETNDPGVPTFTVPAGPPNGAGVITLTGHDIVNMNAFDIDDNVQSTLTTTNQLPEGYYDFCFTLLDANNAPIGMPETQCVSVEILHPEPPALISPVNQDVTQEFPQFIWSPVIGASPNQLIKYRITIAPRFEGQNLRTAIEANNPLVDNFVQSTTYQYTPSDLPFDTYSGAVDYVWQVQALDMNDDPVGTNQGKSEIAKFVKVEGGDIDIPNIPIDTSTTVINPPIVVFPTATISGKVKWMIGEPPSSEDGGNGNSGNGSNPNPLNPNQPIIGNLDFSGISYPVKEAKVNVYTTGFPQKLIGAATTDADGNFEVSFTNLGSAENPAVVIDGFTFDVDEVIVSPEEPHFEFPDRRVDLSSSEESTLTAENVYGYAKTYNFEPTIEDSETGEIITDAKVELLRWPRVYEMYPTLEAELPANSQLVKWNNNEFKFYNSVKSGESANLIVAENVFAGAYYLKAYAEGYDTLFSAVVERGNNYDFDSKPTVEKTLRLTSKLPIVEGKIVREDNLEPLSGLSVQLIPSGSTTPRYSTSTSDNGNFLISEIQPETQPYTLKVTGNKINEYTEEVYLTRRGIKIEKYPLKIKAILFAVKGKVADENNQPISNARLIWKSGGNPFYSDNNGNFFTMSPPGDRTLLVSKIGYEDKEVPITVTGSTENPLNLGGVLTQLTTFFQGGSFGNTNFNFSSLGLGDGESSNEGAGMMFMSFNLGNFSLSPDPLDLGFINISQITGKLLVEVLDEENDNPIQGAELKADGKSASTDLNGKAFVTDIATGNITFRIESPDNASYVPSEFEINVPHSIDTAKATVKLEQGATLTGTTNGDNSPLDSVKVRVDGRDDIFTFSDAQGNYTLRGIPSGEYKIYATKSGYLGDSKTFQFSQSTKNHDFNLSTPDMKIDKLMGLEIEVDELKSVNDTLQLTGAFVNIPSNNVFYYKDDFRLPFSNIKVREVDDSLEIYGRILRTDLRSMPIKVFNFLEADAKAVDEINISELGANVLINADTVKLDYQRTFSAQLEKLGWEFKGDVNHYIDPMQFQTPMIFSKPPDLINAAGEPMLQSSLEADTLNLRGFDMIMNLANSTVDSSGLKLRGFIRLDSLAGIDTIRVDVDSLWIDRDGNIRKESSLSLGQAYAAIDSLFDVEINDIALPNINEGKMSGTIRFTLPNSNESTLTFADLKFSKDRLYGGTFGMPGEGINLFKTVTFKTEENGELDFAYDETNDDYYLSGAGSIEINPDSVDGIASLIDELKFNNFTVRSDGGTSYTIRTDLRADFGNILQIEFHTFEIDTADGGDFRGRGRAYFKNIPFVYSDSRFVFRYEPRLQTAMLDSLKAVVVSPLINLQVEGHGVDNERYLGFIAEGEASMLANTVRGDVDFFDYWYIPTGVGADTVAIDSVKAEFTAEIGLPIGNANIIEADGVILKDNTNNKFLVDVNGKLRFGTLSPIALDPIDVTVRTGPVITGSADLRILNQRLFNASVNIDKPNDYIHVNTMLEFEIFDDITPSLTSTQDVVISGKPGNEYWYANFTANAQIPGNLVNGNMSFVLGDQVDLSSIGYNPPNQLSGVNENSFSGAMASASLSIGTSPNDVSWKTVMDKTLAEVYAKSWLYNYTEAYLYLNTNNWTTGFYVGNDWTAGGKVKAKGIVGGWLRASASVTVSGSVAGGYSNQQGYYFSGDLFGKARASLGSCSGNCVPVKVCGSIVPPRFRGVQVCADVDFDVDYSTQNGFSFSLSL